MLHSCPRPKIPAPKEAGGKRASEVAFVRRASRQATWNAAERITVNSMGQRDLDAVRACAGSRDRQLQP